MTRFALTPETLAAHEVEADIVAVLAGVWNLDYAVTDPESDAPLDAVLSASGHLRYVVEVKARNMTPERFAHLDNDRNPGLMLTADKLPKSAATGLGLGIPYRVVVCLLPSWEMHYWHMREPDDRGWLVGFTTAVTRTPRALDRPGTKEAECAYLPVAQSYPVTGPGDVWRGRG